MITATACSRCGRAHGEILDSRFGLRCWSCYHVSVPREEAVKADQFSRANGANPDHGRSSWGPVDLEPILKGDADPEPPPGMLARTDGEFLLYGGKVHLCAGEPEGAKGWLAMKACSERIAAGEHVLYIDFEDEAAAAVDRLTALGVHVDAIAERFHYVRPDEPLDDAGRAAIEYVLATFRPTLAVIDGLTDALAIHGVDLRDNTEVANWMRDLPQGLRRRGIAVFLNDHVVKDARRPRALLDRGTAQARKGRHRLSPECEGAARPGADRARPDQGGEGSPRPRSKARAAQARRRDDRDLAPRRGDGPRD